MRSLHFILISTIFLLGGIVVLFLTTGRQVNFDSNTKVNKVIDSSNAQNFRLVSIKDTNPISVLVNSKKNTLLSSVYFPIGSTSLTHRGKSNLNDIVRTLDKNKNFIFVIDGYADSIGSNIVNNDLIATFRSYSVYEYLISLGLSREQIFIRSYGLQNIPGHLNNRRVDISITEANHP